MSRGLRSGDYQRLLRFRDELRRFLHWSEQEAGSAGLTPAQHQLLLAIRGHPDRRGPAIGDVAGHLLLRHHSAVELVNRAEVAGLVVRRLDHDDQRVVRLALTPAGAHRLESLAGTHLEELARLEPVWEDLVGERPSPSNLPPQAAR